MPTRDALLAAALVVALAAGVRAGRRSGAFLGFAGAALGAAAFGAARFLPGPAFARGLCAMYAVAAVGKTLALGRAARQRVPLGRGLAYLLAYPGLDVSRAFLPDPAPRLPAGFLASILGGIEVAAAFAVAVLARRTGVLDLGAYPAAWARAASFALLLDGLFRGAMGSLRVLRCRTETVFDAPWTLMGLADFWSRRWNRFVSRTLAHEVYEPAKRRAGRVAGVLAAFVASGLLHDALFGLAVEPTSWRYTVFFAAQGVGIVVEGVLLAPSGGAPARRLARWAFAWAVLAATAPLFFGGPYPDAVPLERFLS